MKNFSFKTIVEEVENQKSLNDISQFIKSYFLTIVSKKTGYGWQEMPKNKYGFGAILRFENGDLALLKDGDFTIEKNYEDSSFWPYKSLRSTSFDYKQGSEIPIEKLSKEELNEVYNSIFNQIKSEMDKNTGTWQGD